MKRNWLLIVGCMLLLHVQAQVEQQTTVEQQLENLAEADETETEDDSYLQQLQQFSRNRLNMNTAQEADLQVFRFLSELQIQTFLQYRRLNGLLLSVYELQAVPGWDLETIARIRPYISIGPAESLLQNFGKRLSDGNHYLLFRVGQTLEKSKGFLPKDTLPATYLGGQQRLLFRYKYLYKNQLQYGILGEKDPGEQFFKGAQKNGFDFYSMHLFVRNVGLVKQLALGDFTVNLGQGLLVYQSLAFRKSVDVMNIKRQAETFRPYNSPGEVNFMRGAAITVGKEKLQLSVFASRRKVSANAVVDSVNFEDYISSILTSGFHRTENELNDRYNITQTATGGRLQYKNKQLMLAANGIHYQLSKPLQKQDEPYNQFAFGGDKLTGMSAEFAYTWRNVHAFGEYAMNPGGGKAYVAGLLTSVDPRLDLSLQVRNIDRNYHSLYANAFTESTTPINERGMFLGASLRPLRTIRIDAYADLYSFPWLKFRVDRPSKGKDYVVQFTWKPNKQVEVYTRYRSETKAINYSNTNLPTALTQDVARQNWRTHAVLKVSPAVTLRARTEMVWYDRKGVQAEEGFLVFADMLYKPMMQPLSLNFRLQYFETDDYNSRLYAFENDVLYSFSIPPFYDKGYRGYININYDISKSVTAWLRLARTWYTDRTTVGSGNDEILGNHKTDARFQVLITL